uniref:Calcium voltage-gated channel auxiliary subunit alpha2delta 1 n=1 Tax=Oncorhynchus kisutch TaxID=8019 RepID=A0A8C7I670_ONCKI
QIQIELVTLADTASAGKSLTQIFLDNQNLYTVESNDAEELVARAARNIEQLLLKRAGALETLATAAENFQMEHQWEDEYALEVNYTEGRKYRIRPAFKEDPLFKHFTSDNDTAVHIPTDIYDGSTIVLNELNWTEVLEDVFKKNREDDPTLLWQVFGSATGLARYYPASPWMDARKTPSKIDLYDVRRRAWYIQGAASPKDMLILVDVSGSVSGLTLKLIKTSVSEMLETLSDDDYVNVVYFNTRVNNTACFDHLVQANVRNKKILKDAIQNISAKGITNYTKGFEFAFEQLYATNITRANCNKIIMLFTDGGEERASAILQEHNSDKKVRIFTFSVGQHNYDKVPVQWMACANKGYFYEIPSIGAIRINTQEYLDVLGRPMVLADQLAKQVQWTNVYLDALELGLVITGTLPVFNKTKYKDELGIEIQNQLILGVMGIDVSLDDIKKLTPRYTIGPNGYYFAIDPNGYVLLHPNLQPKVCSILTSSILRIMIDGNPGEETIETLVKTQDERYIDRGVRTYTWAQVNGTDYSLALVLPMYSEHYIEAKLGDTIRQAMGEYTHINTHTLQHKQNLLQRLCSQISEFCRCPLFIECNMALVSRLLLDAGLTADLVKLWKEQTLHGVLARIVATDGGITRVYPRSAGEEWTENTETYDSSFYKRTLDNDIYIFTAPYFNKSRESGYESGILVSKAVDLNIDRVNLKPAVVGVKLNVSAWMNSFMNATIKVNCKDEICGCLKNDKHVDCVILDDGGFLLMSNQDEYITRIGQFFGEVDPVVMISLVNTSLYSFNKTYDYQSVCNPEGDCKAAAGPRSVYVPTIADMLSIGWWASTGSLSLVDSDDDMSANMFKESCITEQTQYFFDNEERSYSGVLDCGNCSRMYRAEKLPNTNLVFLITDAKTTCLSCDPRPLRQAEQPSQGPDRCELAQNPRYRKGPDVCFDNHVDEDDSDCGGGTSLSPSPWPMLGLQLLLLWHLTGPRHS